MATTKETTGVAPLRARVNEYGLTVTPYERVASLVVALLILVGTGVALMFVLWLTSRIFASTEPVPITMQQIGEDGGSGGEDLETDMEELAHEVEFEEPEFQDTLAHEGRFWVDRIHGAAMLRTAGPERMVHLKQVMDNDFKMKEVHARWRKERAEQSRG